MIRKILLPPKNNKSASHIKHQSTKQKDRSIMKKLVAFSCFLIAGLSQANPTIGGDTLLRWMQSRDERDNAIAIGYIGGVREVTFQKDHCATGDIKVSDVASAVQRTLEGMPKYRHLPASWIVIEALKARWPCTENGQGRKTK